MARSLTSTLVPRWFVVALCGAVLAVAAAPVTPAAAWTHAQCKNKKTGKVIARLMCCSQDKGTGHLQMWRPGRSCGSRGYFHYCTGNARVSRVGDRRVDASRPRIKHYCASLGARYRGYTVR